MKTLRISIVIGFMSILITSCSSLYDPITYAETIYVKNLTTSLMDKSNESFNSHTVEVSQLEAKLADRLKYEEAKKKNEVTTKMWKLLNNENKLIRSYLKLWKEKDSVSSFFISEAKPQVEEAFNLLIDYEKRKDKTGSQPLLDFITNL